MNFRHSLGCDTIVASQAWFPYDCRIVLTEVLNLDPSNEYSLLRLTHVMNSNFLDPRPSDEFLTQVVNIESPNKFLASAFTFQNEATK